TGFATGDEETKRPIFTSVGDCFEKVTVLKKRQNSCRVANLIGGKEASLLCQRTNNVESLGGRIPSTKETDHECVFDSTFVALRSGLSARESIRATPT